MASRRKVDENPEWTRGDFTRAKAPEDVLSAEVLSKFGKRRGPQKAPKKVPVSIRLSPSVVSHFRKQGPGWQARIDAALIRIMQSENKVAAGAKRVHTRVRRAG